MNQGASKVACVLLIFGLLIPSISHESVAAATTVEAKSRVFESAVSKYFFGSYERSQDANKFGLFVSERYLKMFSIYQNPRVLKRLSDADLRALFDVTSHTANLNIENSRYRNYLQSDFRELDTRGIATGRQAQDIYYLLYAARLFAQARGFAIRHADAHLPLLPSVRQVGVPLSEASTVLVADTDKNEFARRAVELKHGVKVVFVVSPMCHFAAHGLQAINADPELKKVFQKDVIWLAPDVPLMHFVEYQAWNLRHSKEKIGVAYLPSEWPLITYWGLPTFYFFENGILVKKLTGWWPNPPVKARDSAGNIPNLKKALRQIGLLQPSSG